ncbi:MAG: hypothetical protein HZA25_02075 [Candidatus Niyogibacteria bacterium]|nr:hypothetical protein [Candidatus Niyogibacteria bacterium]
MTSLLFTSFMDNKFVIGMSLMLAGFFAGLHEPSWQWAAYLLYFIIAYLALVAVFFFMEIKDDDHGYVGLIAFINVIGVMCTVGAFLVGVVLSHMRIVM